MRRGWGKMVKKGKKLQKNAKKSTFLEEIAGNRRFWEFLKRGLRECAPGGARIS
jgi:hypothetical protein